MNLQKMLKMVVFDKIILLHDTGQARLHQSFHITMFVIFQVFRYFSFRDY